MIGSPVYLSTTTLPAGFMWADGSLAKFADWPELQAKYNAGGFAGMVLAYNASDGDKAAYPGKWVPNAANPTGLFLPRLGNLFFRNWVGSDGNAGTYGRDEIRDITGALYTLDGDDGISLPPHFGTMVWQRHQEGALYQNGNHQNFFLAGSTVGTYGSTDLFFAASRIVPTGPENVPPHVRQPLAAYLGTHV